MSSQSQKSQALLSLWRHLVLTSIAKQTHMYMYIYIYIFDYIFFQVYLYSAFHDTNSCKAAYMCKK